MAHQILDEQMQESSPASIEPLLGKGRIIILNILMNCVVTYLLLPFLVFKFGFIVPIIVFIIFLIFLNKLMLVLAFGKAFKVSFFINGSVYFFFLLFRAAYTAMFTMLIVLELEDVGLLECLFLLCFGSIFIVAASSIELMVLFDNRNKEIERRRDLLVN